jgi:ribose transport system permease protein
MLPLAWLLVIGGFGIAEPGRFLSAGNLAAIAGSQAVLFTLTIALLLPLTCGDIDLSVGPVCGLVAMIIAILNVQHGVPIVVCCLIGLAAGTAGGLLNGLIVVRAGADPLIITLGMGAAWGGVTELLSGQQTITGVSPWLTNVVFTGGFLGVPLEFWYGAAVMLIMYYLLRHTPYGLRALITGQSREVARLSGFPVGRARMEAFAAAGLIAAFSGILSDGTAGSATAGDGNILTISAVAAVYLGQTTIQPGRPNAFGSGIAVYFLATGVAGLELAGAQEWVQQTFYGVILVVAVVCSQALARQRAGTTARLDAGP